jgi:hypothetical protein
MLNFKNFTGILLFIFYSFCLKGLSFSDASVS